jgi:hypothetical protein
VPSDRLYVLEFQGYESQYVIFGHTTNLMKRLSSHRLAAAPHGFALLQGWVSPGMADARLAEQQVLMVASMLHGSGHFHERFYDMPYDKGLSIARAVFESGTWDSPSWLYDRDLRVAGPESVNGQVPRGGGSSSSTSGC